MAESGERNLVAALTAALNTITKDNSGDVYSTENRTGWHNDQRHYPSRFKGSFQNHATSLPWGPIKQTKNPRTGNDWVSRIPVPPPPPFPSGYSQGFSRIPVPPPPCSSHSHGYQQRCNGQGKVSCGNIPVRLYSGRLVSYDAEREFGSIACEEIQVTTGQNVKVHYGLLQHSGTGLGDTIVFSVAYPESGVLQAVKPALRIACANAFALTGVFHASQDDASKEFGYIDCKETKAAFGRNVCVSMEVAAWLSLGQRVVFNAMLEKDAVLRVTIAEVATKYNSPIPGHYNLTKSGQVVDAGNVFPQSTGSSANNIFGENGQSGQTNMDLANEAFVRAEACLSCRAFAAAGTWITAAVTAARGKPPLDTGVFQAPNEAG